ncbi:hypothetical protein N356_gp103 [Cellulophaga phage phi14:2]|uniref:Uncharacterized protein n=1 Tax=Cellulophaga phage phi14:2 TaxID=1327990 RepID=S0A0V5_9CAUD|nr:hypothetical protein N356_gp103 [Cellulophaga phage phi14:2]AGO48996.1 hypothetical protein Phi14:2_gp118 [Cellulophaga phage phi14:2]
MWIVTVYRDNGYSGENYTKKFDDEDDAIDFFTEEVKDEFREEIEEGLVSDQEIQNIVNNNIYTYDSEDYEVTISLELIDDEEDYI